MKNNWLILSLIAVMAIPFSAAAQDKEAVVHEAWFVHMESAGGWVAMDKGFYGKVKVNEVQGGPGISPIQKVVAAVRAGNIAFGNDYPENIIRAREREGIDLVAVSVDFQTSAMRIISWKPIKSAKDIKGDFGIWIGYDAKAKCAVGKDWEKQFSIQNQGGDIKPWLAGTWPLASAMTYNELITAQRETKKMKKTFYTTDYKDLGIDWMDNVLFTTEEIIKKHPDVVQAVVTGRYKGFQFAFQNPKETFQILKKFNEGLDLAHEMDAVGPMKTLMITALTKKKGLGYINPKKWNNVAKDMSNADLLEKMPDVKKVYSEKFPSGVVPK
jgi:NitT/TauT family transport system substrate-binding protein